MPVLAVAPDAVASAGFGGVGACLGAGCCGDMDALAPPMAEATAAGEAAGAGVGCFCFCGEGVEAGGGPESAGMGPKPGTGSKDESDVDS